MDELNGTTFNTMSVMELCDCVQFYNNQALRLSMQGKIYESDAYIRAAKKLQEIIDNRRMAVVA